MLLVWLDLDYVTFRLEAKQLPMLWRHQILKCNSE